MFTASVLSMDGLNLSMNCTVGEFIHNSSPWKLTLVVWPL